MARDSEPGRPQPPAACPDLEEALSGPGLAPEYVVAYIPPNLSSRIVYWLAAAGPWGLWALITAAECESGEVDGEFIDPGRRTLSAPRSVPGELLAIWVSGLLGFPVALEPGTARYRAGHMFARPHEEPLFLVRRDT